MIRTHAPRLLAIAGLACFAARLPAADAAAAPDAKDFTGHIDMAVPDVPAASVLGLSPDSVIRPTTGRDFSAALLNGIGQDGKLQSGIAVDVRPALFLAQEYFTLANYRDKSAPVIDAEGLFPRYKMKRGAWWAKLRTSFATGRTEAGEGEADRYAIGANWNLFDYGDSRLSPVYEGCVQKSLKALNDAISAVLTNPAIANDDAKIKEIADSQRPAQAAKVARCAREFEERNWNADSWDFGAAYFDFNTKLVKSQGYAAWTTYARHLGGDGQLILHARFSDDEVAASPDDPAVFVVQDARILGARLRWKAPGGAFLLEATHRDINRRVGADDRYTLASVGYELHVAEGMWIQLAYGKAFGTDAFKNDPVFSGQLRWGKSNKSLGE